jgi:23S rRNA pseudouridine2457 synthase
MIIVLNKPYGVLSQFTSDGSENKTLSEFGLPPNVYSIGRLDADSEGLLLLSDESLWNDILLNPKHHIQKTYHALVERSPSDIAIDTLCTGVELQDGRTKPASARILEPQPVYAERIPPVRFRKNVQDVWIELIISEGKNRQVRRMTAKVGHPTLRLIRVSFAGIELEILNQGEWRELTDSEKDLLEQHRKSVAKNITPKKNPPHRRHGRFDKR